MRMNEAQTQAYLIIEDARFAINKEKSSRGSYTNDQFHAICILLSACDYLATGKARNHNYSSGFFTGTRVPRFEVR